MTDSYAPIADAAWPDRIADMRTGFAGQLNVYRVMAHHPDLLRAWAGLRSHIVQNTALGPVRAEVVILRLGHRLGSSYEWNQHVVRALRVGFTTDRIATLQGALTAMSDEDALLAGATDALFDDGQLAPAQLAALDALVGRAGVLDLMATAGMYLTLGFILKSTGTPLDSDVAADLDRLAPELRR